MLAVAITAFSDPVFKQVRPGQLLDLNLDRYQVLRDKGLVRLPPPEAAQRTVPVVEQRPDWDGLPAVIVASGPSLTDEDCAIVAKARASNRCRVIVVNDNWRKLPDADLIYAADFQFWRAYHKQIAAGFAGERWTQDYNSSLQFGLRFVLGVNQPGLSTDPRRIHTGSNSGYQAIGLAYHFGAQKIALLGFDMQRTDGKAHWFGDHPAPLTQPNNLHRIVPKFDRLAADLAAAGVQVINCSRATALQCFEREPIKNALRNSRHRAKRGVSAADNG